MIDIKLDTLKNKKLAFVCSGGVVKAAAWHVGVALALQEIGLKFQSNLSETHKRPENEISTYVGSSAGALICLYLASGFTPEDIVKATLSDGREKLPPMTYREMLSLERHHLSDGKRSNKYQPLEGLPFYIQKILSPITNLSGIFTTKGIAKYLEKNVLEINDFDHFVPDVFITATQLDQSKKIIFGKYNYPNPSHDPTAVYRTGNKVTDAAAASMSVPPFYAPYPILNKDSGKVEYLIDGEIRETLSSHVAIDNKCDFIINSWTHTPYHFHDEVGSLVNYGLPAICIQAIYLMIQKKIIASRARANQAKDIIETVNEYCLKEKFSNKNRNDIIGILERKLNFDKNVKFLDIYPSHNDYKFFFASSFSLRKDLTAQIVRSGRERTLELFSRSDIY